MQTRSHYDGLARVALPPRPVHLAIGMFDGVHVGHQAVIGAAVAAARRDGGLAAVLTFWPHPSALFHPHDPTPLLLETPLKTQLLFGLGVEAVITQPFTGEFARIEAEGFLPYLRGFLPRLAAVYVGSNWRFGRGRRGDAALLAAEGGRLGIGVLSLPPVSVGGEPVSSTRIRRQLAAGDIASANAGLGRPYTAVGRVVPGKRLGRALGFPTLNLDWTPPLRPRAGVYAVRAGRTGTPTNLPGVANYGLRPTVEEAREPRLEVHLLGECPFGEGDDLTVEWLAFLRPERTFAQVGELREQISRDRAAAAAFFAG